MNDTPPFCPPPRNTTSLSFRVARRRLHFLRGAGTPYVTEGFTLFALLYGAHLFEPTPPLLPLAVRAVNKPHSSGTVRELTQALTHLASARTMGVHCAMKFLARP